jgi:AraC-like DNA-binding protein
MRAFHENRTYDEGFPVSIFRTENLNFIAHWHMDVEMVYVCEGCIRIGINKECHILNKGELAVCSSGDIHYYDNHDLKYKIIIIIFRPEFVGNLGGWPGETSLVSPFIQREIMHQMEQGSEIHKKFEFIFNNILEESTDKHKFYQSVVKSRLIELCAIIQRYFLSDPADNPGDSSRFSRIKSMQEILTYLENNFMQDITLQDAAKSANTSPFYFSRLFKQITGMNYLLFINRLRVEKAESLLKTSSASIAQIAFDCGFNSIRTFNRVFKSIKGTTPKAQR